LNQSFEHRDLTRKNSEPDDTDHNHQHNQQHHFNHLDQEPTMTSPRPVFQAINNKGNRSANGRGPSHEIITPQHEELIRFFNE
ncbi:hypothetical protein SK128_024535, partial [Halocaridina rubra]